jgi:5-methyltetrahydrofolate--homocysteine methyltransferase
LQVKQFFEKGLVNAIGGCCGSSFAHIAALADTAADFAPRKKHGVDPIMRISGLEPLNYVRCQVCLFWLFCCDS